MLRSSCDACLKTKVKCSQTKESCSRCLQHGRPCVYSQYRRIGRPSFRQARPKFKPSSSDHPDGKLDPSLHPIHYRQLQIATQCNAQLQGQSQQDEPAASSSSLFHTLPDITGISTCSTLGDFDAKQLFGSPPDYLDASMDDFDWALVARADVSSIFSSDSEYEAACFSPINLAPTQPVSLPTLRHALLPTALPTISTGPLVGNAAPSRACDMDLHSRPRSRCTMQCHLSLNILLGDMNDTSSVEGSKDSPRLPLDVLLHLERRLGHIRSQSLRCSGCMVTHGVYTQTLMLITMAVERLLGLFESSCSSAENTAGDEELVASLPVYGRLDQAKVGMPTLPSKLPESNMQARHTLPGTRKPLIVGTIQLDDSVRLVFSRWVLRLYLDRQLAVVKELGGLLCPEKIGGKSAMLKVTAELLADIAIRLEFFVGFTMIVDVGTESPRVADIDDLEI